MPTRLLREKRRENEIRAERKALIETRDKLLLFAVYGDGASGIINLSEDSQWGVSYKFVGAFTDNAQASGTSTLETLGIPCHCIDWELYRKEETDNTSFYEHLASLIDNLNPDIIVFAGFMRIIPDWFIKKFKGRMLNIHPTDLFILDPLTGKPLYIGRGSDAIAHVMADGLTTICPTVACIEEGSVDCGRIIAQSQSCAIVSGDTVEIVHQRLKDFCEWKALQNALAKIVKMGWQRPINLFQYTDHERRQKKPEKWQWLKGIFNLFPYNRPEMPQRRRDDHL
jgi:phosphoribosylglycinamide formyltransferase-1